MATSDRKQSEGQAEPSEERSASGAVRPGPLNPGDWDSGPICSSYIDGQWLISRYDQSQAGRTESVGKVGMEAGDDKREPSGESAKAEGGKRKADLPFLRPGAIVGPFRSEPRMFSGYYASGVHRAKGLGVVGAAEAAFAWGYAFGTDEQVAEASISAYRRSVTTIFIGIAIGVALSFAHGRLLGS